MCVWCVCVCVVCACVCVCVCACVCVCVSCVCVCVSVGPLVLYLRCVLCTPHTGGRAVNSEGRLIPHNFPITDLQQITAS